MPTYEQIPVRLQINMAGSPPYPPFDANTGQVARIWRASATALQIGIFDAFGVPVDLSNLAYLQLVLQDGSDAVAPLVVKTVVPPDILPMTVADWNSGLGQQVVFNLTAAETDQGLDAEPSKFYWIAIQGKTQLGNILTYGAGQIELFDVGTTVPSPVSSSTVSRSNQILTDGDLTIAPTTFNHTAFVEVNGVARTSNIILPLVGMVDGALLRLRLNLPATPDIIIQVCSETLGNVISTIQTGSVLSAFLEYVFDENLQQWDSLTYIVPATN